MQVTETLAEGLKRAYTIVLAADDIEHRRTARLVDLGKTLRLPGFRPGKVPLPVVRQRFGSAVTAEVVEQSVSDATRQVLSERGLRAALQPKVDLVSADPTRDLEFKVEVELLPDITLPDFSAVDLTRLKAEATPDAVDEALGRSPKGTASSSRSPPMSLGSRAHKRGKLSLSIIPERLTVRSFREGAGPTWVWRWVVRVSSPVSASSSRASALAIRD